VDHPSAPTSAADVPPTARRFRLLIVDDSAAIREVLTRIFRADPHFEVVGTAQDGEEAVALTAQLCPDVVTMDIHLPRLNGVQATRRIMAETPTPIVIVSASVEQKEIGLAFEALQAGAVTVLDKPPAPDHPRYSASVRELVRTVRLMAQVKVVRRWATREARPGLAGQPASPMPMSSLHRRRPVAIMVVASTGGPQAIQRLLQALGGDLSVPVLMVQHINDGFAAGMVDWLSSSCPQQVRLAEHGDTPSAGVAYLSPGDRHLLVTRRGTLALSKAPSVGGFRPSGTLLFSSGSEYYGANAVGVLLTGMGEDGAEGLSALRAAGGITIAQDEATSVVYGMPAAAVALGAAEHVLPLAAIGPEIRAMLGLDSRSGPLATGPRR
jgi:two-component system chemotaxis response regulator CheB